MSRDEIVHWARAFIDAQQGDAIDANHPLWWAVEKFTDTSSSSIDDRWEAIVETLNRIMAVFGMLAAGPLEDLIAENGVDVIDRVEQEAARNKAFRHLLSGVWPRGGSEEIWTRVQKVRDA